MKTCTRCGKEYDDIKGFYDDVKEKRMDVCKQCVTSDINVYGPFETPELFQYLDIPILIDQWWDLVEKYYIPQGINATAIGVFGRYRSKMKLMSFRNMRFSDSEYYNNLRARKDIENARLRMGFNY